MFAPDTILVLKEPREPTQKTDPYTGEPRMVRKRNPRTGELEDTKEPHMLEFPYNRVRVIGESPVVGTEGEWKGSDARRVIIEPLTDFAGNLDEPFGKLRKLYDVEYIPERVTEVKQTIRQINATTNEAGPTPEEVFAKEAPGKPPAKGLKRGRTGPFDDVHNDATKSPLD